jgi:hypothetical protein
MKLARRATHCRTRWLHVLVWFSMFVAAQPLGATQVQGSSTPWLQTDARADSCVDGPALVQEVERILDRKPTEGMRVKARARGRGWRVEMWHAAGQYAVREFPVLPDACDVRLRALALSIALAVEHGAASTLPHVVEHDEAAPGWATGLHAGLSVGELPNPAAALGLDVRIERGKWVPLEMRVLADVWTSEPSFAGARLATRQLMGALASCLTPSAKQAWRFDFCLGFELGAALGRADGIALPETAAAGSGALNFGLVSRWAPRRRFALTARLEGFARFWTPRFRVLEADGALFAEQRLPPAGGRLWFGVAWLSK